MKIYAEQAKECLLSIAGLILLLTCHGLGKTGIGFILCFTFMAKDLCRYFKAGSAFYINEVGDTYYINQNMLYAIKASWRVKAEAERVEVIQKELIKLSAKLVPGKLYKTSTNAFFVREIKCMERQGFLKVTIIEKLGESAQILEGLSFGKKRNTKHAVYTVEFVCVKSYEGLMPTTDTASV